MTEYIREVKIQLRDVYGLEPVREVNGEPIFGRVKDGIYPMTIDGKEDLVIVSDNRFIVCLPIMKPISKDNSHPTTVDGREDWS